mmetsp:Transcript_10703/g.35094  ORF Transcript_10703/g.35094 Transcript_10703/m.35094 type:complete len:191 (-) Transcript_10703:76-648(-)
MGTMAFYPTLAPCKTCHTALLQYERNTTSALVVCPAGGTCPVGIGLKREPPFLLSHVHRPVTEVFTPIIKPEADFAFQQQSYWRTFNWTGSGDAGGEKFGLEYIMPSQRTNLRTANEHDRLYAIGTMFAQNIASLSMERRAPLALFAYSRASTGIRTAKLVEACDEDKALKLRFEKLVKVEQIITGVRGA